MYFQFSLAIKHCIPSWEIPKQTSFLLCHIKLQILVWNSTNIGFGLGHPSCLDMTMELVSMIKTYPWQCMECKTCIICGQPHHEEEMMFCDVCDRGYHTFCVGLGAIPSGKGEKRTIIFEWMDSLSIVIQAASTPWHEGPVDPSVHKTRPTLWLPRSCPPAFHP